MLKPKKPSLRKFEQNVDAEAIEKEVNDVLGDNPEKQLTQKYEETIRDFKVGEILDGKVLNVLNNEVYVDVGYKSEGIIDLNEFDKPDEVSPGDQIEVLLEAVEDDSGLLALSKRKADRIRGWEKVISVNDEGDVVTGCVTRKIKGGLLVDIGVPVFLPASQVNIRRTGDISDYIGKDVECKIIKIDQSRRNIVVSRRKLLEERREEMKKKLLDDLEIGQMRTGIVKSITDFGAFVDLGGIDGLLHITDMSWGRISHPSEVVAIDQEIEIKILNFDIEKEKISLGLKQKTESPWVKVPDKYPIDSRVTGQVVNVMSYGAFVKLEEGVEGLVHISEMSWTRRINHPSELVAIGDTIEVVVLGINIEKEEISLGMKQTETNPWTQVEHKYPTGTIINGRVRNLTNYGAFIEIEEGIDGLLHISDMSWTKKIRHPSELLKKGQRVETMVLSVNQEKKRVSLGMKQLVEDPWESLILEKYQPGMIVNGTATKFTNFGVFIELDEGLEGLLHISELSDRKVESPEEVVSEGEKLRLVVIRVDPAERKIGLSLRRVEEVEAGKATEAIEEFQPQSEPKKTPPPDRGKASVQSHVTPEGLAQGIHVPASLQFGRRPPAQETPEEKEEEQTSQETEAESDQPETPEQDDSAGETEQAQQAEDTAEEQTPPPAEETTEQQASAQTEQAEQTEQEQAPPETEDAAEQDAEAPPEEASGENEQPPAEDQSAEDTKPTEEESEE